jgi:protein tyrosine/serine phosphatase
LTTLVWEGCLNVRDLGGLPTEDGRRIRNGAVVRSDNIRRLTDEGWRSLREHGVERIIDLRWPTELADDQPRDVDIEVVHVSVLGEDFDPDYVADLDEHLHSVDEVVDHYVWSYLDFLERYRDRFGRAVAAVADAEGTVVVHCLGGKDRTGLVAALLLRLAGVGLKTIGADYAASGPNLEPRSVQWIAEAPDEVERAKRELLSHTPAEGIERVLAEIERRYGDVGGYLRAAGLTEGQLGRLRERLVAP